MTALSRLLRPELLPTKSELLLGVPRERIIIGWQVEGEGGGAGQKQPVLMWAASGERSEAYGGGAVVAESAGSPVVQLSSWRGQGTRFRWPWSQGWANRQGSLNI